MRITDYDYWFYSEDFGWIQTLKDYKAAPTLGKIFLFYDGQNTSMMLRFFAPWDAQAVYGNPYLLDSFNLMRHSNYFRTEIAFLQQQMIKIYWGAGLYE